MATLVCCHGNANLWARKHSTDLHATLTNKEHIMNLYCHENLKSYRRSPVLSAYPSHQLLIRSDNASLCEPFTIGPDCSQYHCNYAAPTINFTHQRPWSGLGVPARRSAIVQSTGWFERERRDGAFSAGYSFLMNNSMRSKRQQSFQLSRWK